MAQQPGRKYGGSSVLDFKRSMSPTTTSPTGISCRWPSRSAVNVGTCSSRRRAMVRSERALFSRWMPAYMETTITITTASRTWPNAREIPAIDNSKTIMGDFMLSQISLIRLEGPISCKTLLPYFNRFCSTCSVLRPCCGSTPSRPVSSQACSDHHASGIADESSWSLPSFAFILHLLHSPEPTSYA